MLSITVDTKQVSRMLSDLQKKQLPYASALALTDVAFTAQAAERAILPSVFHNPRPFTQRSVLVTKATKSNLSASVFIRPEVAAYLAPYEFGGSHVVPGAAQLVPIHMRLDQYGQLTKATRALLNARANDPNSNVFFGTVHNVRGYWMRVKAPARSKRPKAGRVAAPSKLTLIAVVEQPVEVKEHLDFIANATHQALAAWPDAFERAMAKALTTARR